MASDRKQLRVVVLAEDKRQERFLRTLLGNLGFSPRKVRFRTAPAGLGAAEAWVRKQFPTEVRAIRSKNYQTSLCLLAMRDGDSTGTIKRKNELMTELASAGLEARQAHERIALPVPTWSVETWLLALLGEADLSESASYKTAFPPTGRDESQALDNAAAQWANASTIAQQLPSLADGAIEIARLLQP